MPIQITIDHQTLTVPEGLPLRKAALKNGIYVPGICGHPDLPNARQVHWSKQIYQGDRVIVGDYTEELAGDDGSCNLCLVKVEGTDGLVRACSTPAEAGMVVRTTGDDIVAARRESLAKILAHHPHACLTCAQSEGCSLTQCSSNVPEDERCCKLLNRCELGKIVDFVGLPDGTPKYVPEGLPKIIDDSYFDRDYNLCISCLRCVRICRDVRGVDVLGATIKDGRVWVGTHEKGLLPESYCRFCGACVEICPTGALMDKPDAKPVSHGDQAPCVVACPAGIDIPAYIRRIALGDYQGALEVIYDRVPFPGILGYVCFHPCEDACKRNDLGYPAAICALKRFAYENAPHDEIFRTEKADSSGKRIAIVGAGPAGMTAAYYLARSGHDVTLFEAADRPGGMLRYAIPQYRLPQDVLDDELTVLDDLGVKIEVGQRLGRDLQLDALQKGYDAVLITIGATAYYTLGVPGEDLSGVLQTLDFLKSIREGDAPRLEGKVVVIGGGNVAIDAAMSARRLGSDDVTMVCLESRKEMPAHDWEIEQAKAENIKILNGWGPLEFTGSDGSLTGVTFKRCTRVFDANGKFNPQYDETDTQSLAADHVLIAIGQKVDKDGLTEPLAAGNLISVKAETYRTGLAGIYAAGDDISGPASVIEAVTAGRRVADQIDRDLGGPGLSWDVRADDVRDDPHLGRDELFHQRPPTPLPVADPATRVSGFGLIEQSLTADDAQSIALQCLRCNLRATITPVKLPPDKWQPLTRDTVEAIPAAEGVYQLADGAKKITKIVGTADIKDGLLQELDKQPEGTLFCWEEDRMYSKRESELIQQYLQEHGEMPGGGDDDLDDLF